MEIRTKDDQGCFVAEVRGRLDAATSPDFEKRCGSWIDEGRRKVIFDFSGLDYISSAGLRSILAAGKKLKGLGGGLALCGLQGVVREVFTISGFDGIFPVHDDVAGAAKALAGHA